MLVFDNADDPALKLSPFMPKNSGVTIVITSRNRDIGNLSTIPHVELGEMEADEAMKTLMRAARREPSLPPEEMEGAQKLMKELGCLAVALVQAGTYCHQLSSYQHGILHPYTFTQYLSLFYVHRSELMKKAQPSPLDSYERGVYTTLDLSYQVLPQASRDFLHFISFFHHTDISLAVLAAAARKHFEDVFSLLPRPEDHGHIIEKLKNLLCVNGEWNELHVQDIVRNLRSFSLISAVPVGDSLFLRLHPLVQSWSRDMVYPLHHHRAMAMQALTSCGAEDAFLLYRYLLPHITNILSQDEARNIHVNDLTVMGKVLASQGYYRKATELLEIAVEEMISSIGPETEETITVTEMLASHHWENGEWDEAEKLEVEVLERRRRLLGMEHPDTIQAATSLAMVYYSQGRLNEAEKLQVEVLEQYQRLLGMDHMDTTRAAANLAGTYWKQGRQKEAEVLELEVLQRRTSLLGAVHPETLSAATNLATTYYSQGRWSESEKIQLETLEKYRKFFGIEYPDTIRVAANLALTYWKLGRYSEAEKLQLEVLEQRRRLFGMDHQSTILAASNLAGTYSAQGRWSEAEEMQVEVLEMYRKRLGMGHPDTVRAMGNLAMTYFEQGRQDEAEKLELEVLDRSKKLLGPEHPDTVRVSANLATMYARLDRWDEAVGLLAPAVKISLKVSGKQHPDTQQYVGELVSLYEKLGRSEEAREAELLLL